MPPDQGRTVTGAGRRGAAWAILDAMTPVDAGPPIATVNPGHRRAARVLRAPVDAAAVEARLATAAAGADPVGGHDLRASGPACW